MIGGPGYAWVLPGRLAQGSNPPLTGLSFDMLVLCAQEFQTPSPTVPTVLAPLDDAQPTARELAIADWASKKVATAVRRGKRVLVVCHMGWNRSGLVTGLALVRLGVRPHDAIARIRAVRGPRALGNAHFRQVLLSANA